MAVSYLALDAAGREVRGDLDAPDAPTAATLLRGQGLFPLELRVERAGVLARGSSLPRWLPRFVTSSDQVLFLGQLGLMLRSGLPLLESLETLRDHASRRALREIAARLSLAVQTGTPLSAALEQESAFPALVAQLVRVAETTGELELACARGAEAIDRAAALRYQVLSALFYPAIVLVCAGGVVWFLTTNVVPKFAVFLQGRGKALPDTTQALMDASTFLTTHGSRVGYAAVALVATAILTWKTERGRSLIDRALVRVPGLSRVISTAAMAHLGHTLSVLLRSGLPILDSLQVTSGSFGHRGYRRVLNAASERVVQGSSLAQSLAHPTVPPLCVQVIAVGERTGSLDDVLDEMGRFYEGRLQRLLKILSGLVEPLVILLVGGAVGFVYISFFQALFALAR